MGPFYAINHKGGNYIKDSGESLVEVGPNTRLEELRLIAEEMSVIVGQTAKEIREVEPEYVARVRSEEMSAETTLGEVCGMMSRGD